MAHEIGDPTPAEVADYISDTVAQLASMAQAAGFTQTAALLVRAELSALADLRSQARRAASDDAA